MSVISQIPFWAIVMKFQTGLRGEIWKLRGFWLDR